LHDHWGVAGVEPGRVEVVLVVEAGLLDEWQKLGDPAQLIRGRIKQRQALVGRFIVEAGQRQLFQVTLACGAVGGLADLLDGREQQANQDGDDGNHHQQLDQRETRMTGSWFGQFRADIKHCFSS
jgi:hypothetical protein